MSIILQLNNFEALVPGSYWQLRFFVYMSRITKHHQTRCKALISTNVHTGLPLCHSIHIPVSIQIHISVYSNSYFFLSIWMSFNTLLGICWTPQFNLYSTLITAKEMRWTYARMMVAVDRVERHVKMPSVCWYCMRCLGFRYLALQIPEISLRLLQLGA